MVDHLSQQNPSNTVESSVKMSSTAMRYGKWTVYKIIKAETLACITSHKPRPVQMWNWMNFF